MGEFLQISFTLNELEQNAFNFITHVACSFQIRKDSVDSSEDSAYVPTNAETHFKDNVNELEYIYIDNLFLLF